MDYSILAAEVRNDPLGRGYVSLTDRQVADSMNGKTRPKIAALPMRQVLRWAAVTDAIYALQQGAASGQPAKRKLCNGALAMINSPHTPDLDLSDREVSQMLTGLVVAGIFTQTQADELVARATVTISRTEELGLPRVDDEHIRSARMI